ncbi:hypothetical protein [Streptomyces sp. NPDC006925]
MPGYVLPSPGKLRHYRDPGAEEVLPHLPSGSETEVLRTLDDHARYL